MAYSKPITPETWKSLENEQRAEILYNVAGRSGFDGLSKDEYLETLENHPDPSHFTLASEILS